VRFLNARRRRITIRDALPNHERRIPSVKVTLLRDVLKLGKKGEEKEVSDGYARNYLLRHKLAVTAGSGISLDIKKQIQIGVKQKEKQKREEIKLAAKLAGLKIVVVRPANQQGHLFAAISPQEIVKSLEKALHIFVDPDKIEIRQPIKSLGQHKVWIKVGDTSKEFTVDVKPSVS